MRSKNPTQSNTPAFPTRYEISLPDGIGFKIEGTEEFVERHISDARPLIQAFTRTRPSKPIVETAQLSLPWAEVNETENELPSANESPSSIKVDSAATEAHYADVGQYYFKHFGTEAKPLRDQYLIIAWFAEKHQNRGDINAEYVGEAYKVLGEIPLEPPSQLGPQFHKLVAAKTMRKIADGRFALTITGRQHVEQLLATSR